VPIRILPDDVASAIAAGEVVERPASVVKELVENALDAGAANIDIDIEEAGKRLIAVSDDGVGIPSDELPLAAARYATSKLETASDLFSIETLGFRGEALASIGAVSRMELISRTADEETGARILIEAGKASDAKRIAASPGTVVRVRDLFYNVPARLQFLKSDNTERRRINQLVTQYAIAYPEVRFTLSMDGRERLSTSGSGDRREVVGVVFGTDQARRMLHVQSDLNQPYHIDGYTSPPDLHRGTRREIHLFVNGRYVQDPALATAVIQAYHTLLMVGRYPTSILFLIIPSDDVDVNVHPTKAEVRFKDPQQVFRLVQRSIRATLLGQVEPPDVQFRTTWDQVGEETTQVGPRFWSQLQPIEAGRDVQLQPALPGGIPLLRPVGQVGAAYLVAEGPDGLYLVDQHAAHERILFEQMLPAIRQDGQGDSQALLEPHIVELTPAERAYVDDSLDVLHRLGFELEPFGGNAYRLRAIPVLLAKREPTQALRAVLDDLEEDAAPMEGKREEQLITRICKRFAVKAGQVLSLQEQEQLLRSLEACQSPRTCPHGRPTMIHLSVDSLERQFGRHG